MRPIRRRSTAGHFRSLFGAEPLAVSSACGRVNLIGEHTDYNGGFVLPTLIPQATTAALAPTLGPARARVEPRAQRRCARCASSAWAPKRPAQGWLDYVQGVTVALRQAGFEIGGFDLALASDVPLGSGLSSSAALEVSLLRALRRLFALDFDDVRLAKLGRAAETEFVGAPIGIMDQMASSLAGHRRGAVHRHADARHWPRAAAAGHGAGRDQLRRRASSRARRLPDQARGMRARVGAARRRRIARRRRAVIAERIAALPAPLDRRARHVVTENQRVLDAVAAMRAGDAAALGALFSASHASERDDYECSVPEVDLLVAIAEREPDVYGARLTGGGFGGSIVALVREGRGAAVAAAVAAAYASESAQQPSILVPRT